MTTNPPAAKELRRRASPKEKPATAPVKSLLLSAEELTEEQMISAKQEFAAAQRKAAKRNAAFAKQQTALEEWAQRPPDEEFVETLIKEIEGLEHRDIETVVAIGKRLKTIQDVLGGRGRDGRFGPWVDKRCKFSRATAYRYIRVFEMLGGEDSEKYVKLTHLFAASAVYLLSSKSCPVQAVQESLQRAADGEYISERLARELRVKHDPPKPTKSKVNEVFGPGATLKQLSDKIWEVLEAWPGTNNDEVANLLEKIAKGVREAGLGRPTPRRAKPGERSSETADDDASGQAGVGESSDRQAKYTQPQIYNNAPTPSLLRTCQTVGEGFEGGEWCPAIVVAGRLRPEIPPEAAIRAFLYRARLKAVESRKKKYPAEVQHSRGAAYVAFHCLRSARQKGLLESRGPAGAKREYHLTGIGQKLVSPNSAAKD